MSEEVFALSSQQWRVHAPPFVVLPIALLSLGLKITSSQIQIWQAWNQLDHQRVRNKRVGEDYHKWLQQYGFAVHCFLVDTNTYGIDLS